MSLKAVSFDAAGTLIRVRWQPGQFAVDCLNDLGIRCDRQVAGEVYDRLYASRRLEYEQINASRDHAECRLFWRELTADWFAKLAIKVDLEAFMTRADQHLYHAGGPYFSLYDDVRDVLEALKTKGLNLGILSNWDYSLHRIIDLLGIGSYFEFVIASLEEGVEKPEKALFDVALKKFGVSREEVVHVGDHLIDDVQGALGAGWKSIYIDREGQCEPNAPVPRIQSLSELEGVLKSIG